MLVDAPDDLEKFNDWAIENRWSDGLPLIPPTEERVAAMLAGTTWPASTVIGEVPARQGIATTEVIAINAVMAGCKPSIMPVLIASVQAMLKPEVNLYNVQGTTHPVGMMIMVSGPLAGAVGMHSGSGLFGPGFPVNATLGRAVRLIQMNVGGAIPGETDMATHGGPNKFSFAFAENEPDSPWEPYRISRGYAEEESIVLVFGGEGPRNINQHVRPGSATATQAIMFGLANTIAVIGVNNAYLRPADMMVVVCPEHAQALSDDGWQLSDVQQYLFERARIRYKDWKVGGGGSSQPKYLDAADDDLAVSFTESVEDVHVVVAGGIGQHSVWVPAFGYSHAAAQRIDHPDGSAVLAG